jgi:hypothetical protein
MREFEGKKLTSADKRRASAAPLYIVQKTNPGNAILRRHGPQVKLYNEAVKPPDFMAEGRDWQTAMVKNLTQLLGIAFWQPRVWSGGVGISGDFGDAFPWGVVLDHSRFCDITGSMKVTEFVRSESPRTPDGCLSAGRPLGSVLVNVERS